MGRLDGPWPGGHPHPRHQPAYGGDWCATFRGEVKASAVIRRLSLPERHHDLGQDLLAELVGMDDVAVEDVGVHPG